MKKDKKPLMEIPGIGESIAQDLIDIGIEKPDDLIGKDPEAIFEKSNAYNMQIQDRCLLYVFRCAVYYAETPEELREPEKLKWWNRKDSNES